jgi:hypothetical protein
MYIVNVPSCTSHPYLVCNPTYGTEYMCLNLGLQALHRTARVFCYDCLTVEPLHSPCLPTHHSLIKSLPKELLCTTITLNQSHFVGFETSLKAITREWDSEDSTESQCQTLSPYSNICDPPDRVKSVVLVPVCTSVHTDCTSLNTLSSNVQYSQDLASALRL